MSNLEELYALMSQGETINEVSQQIEEIYKNPLSITEVLRILSEEENQYIRTQAAIQLQYPLKAHWEAICEDPVSEEIKSSILTSLSNEPEMYIRDSILHSMEFIVSKKYPWPQLIQFSRELIEQNKPIQIETALKVLYISVQYISDDDFESLILEIGEYIVNATSSDSINIQIAGFRLFQQIISKFNTPLQSPFSDILERLLSVFKESMVQMANEFNIFSDIIEKIINANNGSVDESFFITTLLEMSQDEKISPECYFHIFSPLSQLTWGNESNLYILKPHVEPIMKFSIICISKSLDDECFEDSQNNGILHLAILVDGLIECMNNEKLFLLADSLLSDETVNDAYATVIIYNRFLFLSQSQVAIKHSADIAKKLLKYMNTESPHVLFEASLATMSLLIEDTENMSAFSEHIIKACLLALESEHHQLIINALNTITMIVDNADFNTEFLESLVPKICELASADDEMILMSAIPALSALVVKSNTDIVPYVQAFLPLIIQAASISEQMQPIIKGDAIKTLAQIISVAPEESSSIIEPSMQLFKECAQTEDTVIIEKLLDAISFLVSAKFDGIETILPFFIEYSIAQLDLDGVQNVIFSEGFDPEEEHDKDMSCVNIIISALSVFGTAAESATELFAPYAEDVAHKALNFTAYTSEFIIEKALCVLSQIIVAYKFDPNEYLKELLLNENVEIFESFYDSVVASMFNFCNSIFDANLVQQDVQEILDIIYDNSLKAIEHKLPYIDYASAKMDGGAANDDADEEDVGEIDEDVNDQSQFNVVESVFQFLNTIVAKYTQFFNTKIVAKFIDSIKRAQKKKLVLELIYATDVLGQLFEVDRSAFSGLVLKFAIKIIIENLALCDGTYRPCPFNAMRRIMSTDPSVLETVFTQIIEKTNEVLGLENEGQPFYNETISGAVSLLFALLKVQGPQFPFETYFPAMFESLPSKYNAEYIYGMILTLFSEEKEIFSQYTKDLIRILSQTFSLKDNDLNEYNLPEDLYTGLLKMLIVLIQNVTDAQEMIVEFVPDENRQGILQTRLSSVSMEE